MKTLYPVDDETYARIGKAYLICSQHPDVFNDVKFKKFCSMFVDVIDDCEDEREARLNAAAHEMYDALVCMNGMLHDPRISELLNRINGTEVGND